jgi:hypothetical protein
MPKIKAMDHGRWIVQIVEVVQAAQIVKPLVVWSQNPEFRRKAIKIELLSTSLFFRPVSVSPFHRVGLHCLVPLNL